MITMCVCSVIGGMQYETYLEKMGALKYVFLAVAQPGGSTAQPPQQTTVSPPRPCQDPPPPQDPSFRTQITLLKVLLWLVLLGLFVELEFGLAYFVLSLFYWMYVGTRGPEEKKAGEKSAYSVFNPGCEAIQGTLTAEQLERELLLRPLKGT
ncbi:SAYSvFN domain-containing protein 1 [Echinops telfairi]|uniref:SAYSvFN domain-containing protein 1 n=1 Tax=Echinops telfairi TaxID=9371 RepID=A0AC55DGH3_ECHTE|nr:SAYSvFN domain-containing protein 1 [Echinops telfairi]